jgi:hypothetical protein
MPVEEWLDVVGYPKYQVSSRGRVRSWKWTGPFGFDLTRSTPRLLSQKTTRHGYKEVNLHRAGDKPRVRLVHRLVLEAFAGPPPSSVSQCAHLNGVPSDNAIGNLVWATPKVNGRHKVQHGTSKKSILSDEKRRAVLVLLAAGFSETETASLLFLASTTVNKIIATSLESGPTSAARRSAPTTAASGS